MNKFARGSRDEEAKESSNVASLQSTIFEIKPAAGAATLLKVDRVIRVGQHVLVAGWRTSPIDLALATSSGSESKTIFKTDREDVAVHFGKASGTDLGFVLVAPLVDEDVALVCGRGAEQSFHALLVEDAGSMDTNASDLMMPALAWLASRLTPFSQDWVKLVGLIPVSAGNSGNVFGGLDKALASANVRHGFVSGWVTGPSAAVAWLQIGNGEIFDLRNAFRLHRDDVRAALSTTIVLHKPGFCLDIEGVFPGDRLSLNVMDGETVRRVAEMVVEPLSIEPGEASKVLFSTPGTSMARLAERMSAVEGPILDALIADHRARWGELPVRETVVGEQVAEPKVSIVIPLYGRSDFVQHQMLEFERDAWIREHAELIYVVDDRSLIERFTADAHTLYRLYGVPFRWVWGGINRGFSGANNLGAARARAPFLLFMNSDVFPQEPGWLQPLLDVLERNADIGVVGPRLVFADGSIQHAGMSFQERPDLGIWINHHPCMGLDPSLDPHDGMSEVPAVTGACMAMRRADFSAIGGWDTGYLIGDFEDSDLCFKLRARGLKSTYLPTVELTHLERQSFRLLGQGEYRTKVVIYNALRHQRLWHTSPPGHVAEVA
ncbi:MAG: glycosyltransferase family 2 protein [Pseudomonadota bacterium]|nr:glycosyltransferase family 2 protein [Pseudomonadota bacterium]